MTSGLDNLNIYFCPPNETLSIFDNRTSKTKMNNCFLKLTIELPIYFLFLLYNSYLYGRLTCVPYNFNFHSINVLRINVFVYNVLLIIDLFLKLLDNDAALNIRFNDVVKLLTYSVNFSLLLNRNFYGSKQTVKCLFVFILLLITSDFLIFVNFYYNVDFHLDRAIIINGINFILLAIYSIMLFSIYFERRLNEFSILHNYDDVQSADEDQSTYYSYLTLNWLDKIIKKGYKNQLKSIEQLNKLPKNLNLDSILGNTLKNLKTNEYNHEHNPILNPNRISMQADIEENQNDRKVNILSVLYKSYGLQFILLGLVKFFNDLLQFSGPLLLNKLIQYIDEKNFNLKLGILYVSLSIL
jgi:hypothetical protein